MTLRQGKVKLMVTQTAAKFPQVKITIDVKENYKNMKEMRLVHLLQIFAEKS